MQTFKMAKLAEIEGLNKFERALLTAHMKASRRRGKNTRTTIRKGPEPLEDPERFKERVEAKVDLVNILRGAHLSKLEKMVVEGWLTHELPVPGPRRSYGKAKEFAESKGIPPKALYVLESRAMKKLKEVANMK
jgi:hypothetical protein